MGLKTHIDMQSASVVVHVDQQYLQVLERDSIQNAIDTICKAICDKYLKEIVENIDVKDLVELVKEEAAGILAKQLEFTIKKD